MVDVHHVRYNQVKQSKGFNHDYLQGFAKRTENA